MPLPRELGLTRSRPVRALRPRTAVDNGHPFRPAWWVPGRHWQTLWSRLFRRLPRVETQRLRWAASDGEMLELHRIPAKPDAPRILLLHGLEGSSRSHYAAGIFAAAHARGWGADLLLFRGCGNEPNISRRFYHSGETTDVDFVLRRIVAEFPGAPLGMVGYSLGGNVLLKYLGEQGEAVPASVLSAVAVSVPYDLEAGSRYLGAGFARNYDRHFLSSLRRKAINKLDRYPDLFDRQALARAKSLFDFDNVVTAPVHGFHDAVDYYARSSARHFLKGIRVPTLLLSAYDDPFLPATVLREIHEDARTNRWLQTEFTARGGHVGFVDGSVPWKTRYYAEWRAMDYLASALEHA